MDGLLNQTPPIPLHALGAMLAIMLGAAQLSMKKGGSVHMLLGRVWVGLMLVVAGSSFSFTKLGCGGSIARYICSACGRYSRPVWRYIMCALAISGAINR